MKMVEMKCEVCSKTWLAESGKPMPFVEFEITIDNDEETWIRPLIVACSKECYDIQRERFIRENAYSLRWHHK